MSQPTHLRKLKGWTQEQFAKTLHVSVKRVQAVEGGKENLTVDSLLKFSRAFGVGLVIQFAQEE